jgi:putative exosortase-associated protein (TIGR04073 family)
MLKRFSILASGLLLAALAAGCAGPEKKLGRGLNNIYEPIRMAEMRRSVEQTSYENPASANYATGVIRGLNRTLARTGVGIYEIITFPIPSYDPVFTDYLAPNPQHPDSYKPGLIADPIFDTDTSVGFSGGEVAPFIPGSRFKIFDN